MSIRLIAQGKATRTGISLLGYFTCYAEAAPFPSTYLITFFAQVVRCSKAEVCSSGSTLMAFYQRKGSALPILSHFSWYQSVRTHLVAGTSDLRTLLRLNRPVVPALSHTLPYCYGLWEGLPVCTRTGSGCSFTNKWTLCAGESEVQVRVVLRQGSLHSNIIPEELRNR